MMINDLEYNLNKKQEKINEFIENTDRLNKIIEENNEILNEILLKEKEQIKRSKSKSNSIELKKINSDEANNIPQMLNEIKK